MTQQMADQFGATIYSPPPGYMDLYSVSPLLSLARWQWCKQQLIIAPTSASKQPSDLSLFCWSYPVMGMTAASGQNETQWASPLPPLNLIPPTPLKDIDNMALRGTLGGNTFTRVSSQQLDLSYYPSNAHTQEWFPEENTNLIDRKSSSQESLTGQRSSETNNKLKEGFVLIDRTFNDLSKSTMMLTNQVINTYLKSHGQEVHSINYWNLTTGGLENDKGKGKEIANVEVHGTPGMAV
ncbi:uncharacterized protein BJ212DRAFT_1301906 [Suillus subaureus]|uniref:Uncharacterized protein n=1 Tax=Suillus subaureus TaxID=48587 RepID=A0A9P7E5U9_9AGAM|nr:uncharacterized protein BJ212DRAFT_1301906 [Suillus subaureus]KAG1811366.1 hypothetical protein BJ212DRAFT_1301906 [Suillus subaureus]